MPWVLSRIFNLGLFSFLVCSSTGQAGRGEDRAGWHRGHVAALPLAVRGLKVRGEGQSPLLSPRVAHGLAEPGRIALIEGRGDVGPS